MHGQPASPAANRAAGSTASSPSIVQRPRKPSAASSLTSQLTLAPTGNCSGRRQEAGAGPEAQRSTLYSCVGRARECVQKPCAAAAENQLCHASSRGGAAQARGSCRSDCSTVTIANTRAPRVPHVEWQLQQPELLLGVQPRPAAVQLGLCQADRLEEGIWLILPAQRGPRKGAGWWRRQRRQRRRRAMATCIGGRDGSAAAVSADAALDISTDRDRAYRAPHSPRLARSAGPAGRGLAALGFAAHGIVLAMCRCRK